MRRPRRGHRESAPVLHGGHASRRQLPRLRGRNQGRAGTRPFMLPLSQEGMEVTTNNARARVSQKMVLELLLSDVPETSYTPDSELDRWARKFSVGKPRFTARHQPRPGPVASRDRRNLDACIQCKRCVRACREEQVNDVIGYAFRGGKSKIVFDLDARWAIPLASPAASASGVPDRGAHAGPRHGHEGGRQAGGLGMPYWASAASSTYHVKGNTILQCRENTAPQTRAGCASRGATASIRAAHDRAHEAAHAKAGGEEAQGLHRRSRNGTGVPRGELGRGPRVCRHGLCHIRDTHGKRSLAGFGSAKGTNEEAYLFQKLVRTGFGSNSVDHCTGYATPPASRR